MNKLLKQSVKVFSDGYDMAFKKIQMLKEMIMLNDSQRKQNFGSVGNSAAPNALKERLLTLISIVLFIIGSSVFPDAAQANSRGKSATEKQCQCILDFGEGWDLQGQSKQFASYFNEGYAEDRLV